MTADGNDRVWKASDNHGGFVMATALARAGANAFAAGRGYRVCYGQGERVCLGRPTAFATELDWNGQRLLVSAEQENQR